MSEHRAKVAWQTDGGDFAHGRYSRAHSWSFDGGVTVNASPSPAVVRPPYSNPDYVDPEEAFVAAICSCHMLTFLHLASRQGYVVESYVDEAIGSMSKNERGTPWVSRVVLAPRIVYAEGHAPTPAASRELHERAHHDCFISASVKTEIVVAEPQPAPPAPGA